MKKIMLGLVAVVFAVPTVSADTFTIGITKGSAIAGGAAIVSKAILADGKHKIVPIPHNSGKAYGLRVNRGELDFGISNGIAPYWFRNALYNTSTVKMKNLRIVAGLFDFESGLFVRESSGIKTHADLRGKRISAGYKVHPQMKLIMEKYLANACLTWDDIDPIPTSNHKQAIGLFKKDRVDVLVGTAGAGYIRKFHATIPGGLRYLKMESDTKCAKEAITRYTRDVFDYTILKADGKTVKEDIPVMRFAWAIWAHKDVSDEVVYDVVMSLYKNEKLIQKSPMARNFKKERMGRISSSNVPYHPGALKALKELNIKIKDLRRRIVK